MMTTGTNVGDFIQLKNRHRLTIGTDVLFEALLFLDVVCIFRLFTTNRLLNTFLQKHPSLFTPAVQSTPMPNICVNYFGFKTVNATNSNDWIPILSPPLTAPIKGKIKNFRDIEIKFPFGHQNLGIEKAISLEVIFSLH